MSEQPTDYAIDICKKLSSLFREAGLYRPMRVDRYDEGTELVYDIQEVGTKSKGRVRLVVERFVGGGFAGQVYRVKVTEAADEAIEGIQKGSVYAMKILIPPSGFSRIFRNLLYWIGFQGPFQLQANPAAAGTGAMWQKFFRRGAKIRFGDEKAVVDIHATFVDETLGSCGELSEWVEGRTWRLEADDHLDFLKQWRRGRQVDRTRLGSPEYRAKYRFMRQFVTLLHDMGGHEFARQYEWSTCKSQPNCLKRQGSDDDPQTGLVAVDFRAGLALLPFLPMSPGDFILIFKGLARGSLVQFDRGDIRALERFVAANQDQFTDMQDMLSCLKASERIYRNSTPDITHNRFKLFYDASLWKTILKSALTGWKVRKMVDDGFSQKLDRSRARTIIFFIIGVIPFFGTIIRRIWGCKDWRIHYIRLMTSREYVKRSFRGKAAESVICWYRAGRVDEVRALRTAGSVRRFICHWPLSFLPVGIHRFLTDWNYTKKKLDDIIFRPVRLYFDPNERETWLREMVEEGREKQILIEGDAKIILSQIEEPFIQKYLKCLAVHVCTLPVTQLVSVMIAVIYIMMHPEMPRTQAWAIGFGIIALFQVVPVSPGSLVRGLYVLYLVVREKNFKDYNIAVFLGFFKYIGYLAFPIQMAYRFPVLARFMAGHWANESVHIVPVFGESGALLEHWVFRLFYNWPLTIRRRIQKRLTLRSSMKNRYWHIGLCAAAAALVFGAADMLYLRRSGEIPELKTIWWLSTAVPMICGASVTLGCGGADLLRRIIAALGCGTLVGILYTGVSAVIGHNGGMTVGQLMIAGIWRIFIFSIVSTIGAIFTELMIPDPDLKKTRA